MALRISFWAFAIISGLSSSSNAFAINGKGGLGLTPRNNNQIMASTMEEVGGLNSVFADAESPPPGVKPFPIKPEDLIARAKEVLSPDIAVGTEDGGESLSDDFEFVAAVVGPLNKDEYLNALGNFKLTDGFALENIYFGFTVDPTQLNRVCFMARQTGTHVGTFLGKEATGKEIVKPPECFHMDFEEDGKLREFGFYTMDRRQGNTGGLGGAIGFLYALGLSPPGIPEFYPYKPSKRYRFLNFITRVAQRFQKD